MDKIFQPTITKTTKEFWEHTKQEKFVLQKCSDCKKFIFYPRNICPYCNSTNLIYEESKGVGEVETFSIIHRAPFSDGNQKVPYCLAIIKLKEGVNLLSNIVDCELKDIKIGMPVKVSFKEFAEFKIPVFKPSNDRKIRRLANELMKIF